jgi:hypothetical protein
VTIKELQVSKGAVFDTELRSSGKKRKKGKKRIKPFPATTLRATVGDQSEPLLVSELTQQPADRHQHARRGLVRKGSPVRVRLRALLAARAAEPVRQLSNSDEPPQQHETARVRY